MGNEMSFKFGAYMKVDVTKVLRERWKRICENKHRVPFSKHCPTCGEVAFSEMFLEEDAPRLYDILPDCDEMYDSTPESMSGECLIILDNTGNVESWLYLDRDIPEEVIKQFPTEKEQEAMVQQFLDVHKDRIEAIEASEIVNGYTIETGFVLRLEY